MLHQNISYCMLLCVAIFLSSKIEKVKYFFSISIKFGNLRFHNSFDSMHSHCLNTALVLRFNLAFLLEWGMRRPPLKDVCPHKIFGKTIDTIGYCFGQFSPLETFSSGKFSATSP